MVKPHKFTNGQRRVLQQMGRSGKITHNDLSETVPRFHNSLVALIKRGFVESCPAASYCLTSKATSYMPEIMGEQPSDTL